MLKTETLTVLSTGLGGRVLIFNNDGVIPPHVIIQNLDDTSSAAIQYQESQDGSTFTNLTGTNVTINPRNSNGQIITSSQRYIAVHSVGAVNLEISVIRKRNEILNNNLDC